MATYDRNVVGKHGVSCEVVITHTHTHIRLTTLFPGLPRWACARKVKPIWILLKQETEWQWLQLGHMQVCTLLQTDNHASNPPLIFFTSQMPFLPPNQQCQSTEGITYCVIQTKLNQLVSENVCVITNLLRKWHHSGKRLSQQSMAKKLAGMWNEITPLSPCVYK